MDNFEDLKNMIDQDISPSSAHKQELKEQVLEEFSRSRTKTQTLLFYGRKIMTSRITKIAAIFLAVSTFAFFTFFMEQTSPSVYAQVQDIIDAMQKIDTVHIKGKDWDDNQVEAWLKYDPNTGWIQNSYIHEIDKQIITVSSTTETYIYNQNINEVQILSTKAQPTSLRFNKFFQDVAALTEKFNGTFSIEDNLKSEHFTDSKLVSLHMPNFSMEAVVDKETNLPLQINIQKETHRIKGILPLKEYDIYYDQTPDRIFEFQPPIGSIIVDKQIESPFEKLPKDFISYLMDLAQTAKQNSEDEYNLPANAQLHMIDEDLNATLGLSYKGKNPLPIPYKGYVPLCGTDSTQIAIYNGKGEKLKSKLTQKKLTSPGRYLAGIIIEDTIMPGEEVSLLGVSRSFSNVRQTGDLYSYKMANIFGRAVVENFHLILPDSFEVVDSSSEIYSYEEYEDYRIYVWRIHVPEKKGKLAEVEVTFKKVAE